MATRILSHLAVFLLWLLHFLPSPILARIGSALGFLFYRLGKRRRQIALTNLARCFPELNAAEHSALCETHFRLLGQSGLDRCLLWWGSKERLSKLISVHGAEHINAAKASRRPIILLAPHFLGMDAGGIGISMLFSVMSMYSPQKNSVFDRLVYQGRRRFREPLLLSRHDGIRATIKALKKGLPFYYLPDMDLGRRDSIFVPFFGIQTATITGLARLAEVSGACIIPCVTRFLPAEQRYLVEISAPWENFPSADLACDTARMNAFIEAQIRTMPEQYYWVHRRFKTRPEGEAGFYANSK